MPEKPWTRFLLGCEHTIGCYDRKHIHKRGSLMFCDVCMAWHLVLREIGIAEMGRIR